MNKLKEIQDRIAEFAVEQYYEPNDMIRILNLLAEITTEIQRVESNLYRVEATLALGL